MKPIHRSHTLKHIQFLHSFNIVTKSVHCLINFLPFVIIMKPQILIFLLLLIHEAHGIRLFTKGTSSDNQSIVHQNNFHGRSNNGVEECKGYHCSGSWVRKLMVSPISSTTTAKNQNDENKEKNGTKEEKLPVDSSTTTEQRQPKVTETYPGVLDLAGMDYSQARRKPPIHN